MVTSPVHFLHKSIYLMFNYVYLSIWEHAHSWFRRLERASALLQLKFQVGVSHLPSMLEIKLIEQGFQLWASSPARPTPFFFKLGKYSHCSLQFIQQFWIVRDHSVCFSLIPSPIMWLKGCSQKGPHELAALLASLIFNQLAEGFSLGK